MSCVASTAPAVHRHTRTHAREAINVVAIEAGTNVIITRVWPSVVGGIKQSQMLTAAPSALHLHHVFGFVDSAKDMSVLVEE